MSMSTSEQKNGRSLLSINEMECYNHDNEVVFTPCGCTFVSIRMSHNCFNLSFAQL